MSDGSNRTTVGQALSPVNPADYHPRLTKAHHRHRAAPVMARKYTESTTLPNLRTLPKTEPRARANGTLWAVFVSQNLNNSHDSEQNHPSSTIESEPEA